MRMIDHDRLVAGDRLMVLASELTFACERYEEVFMDDEPLQTNNLKMRRLDNLWTAIELIEADIREVIKRNTL